MSIQLSFQFARFLEKKNYKFVTENEINTFGERDIFYFCSVLLPILYLKAVSICTLTSTTDEGKPGINYIYGKKPDILP